MASYEPIIHRGAERELRRLDDGTRNRIVSLLKDLATYQEPSSHPKVRALEGQSGLCRVRVGNYRAIVELDKPNLCVLRVGHRSEAYEIVDDGLNERRTSV